MRLPPFAPLLALALVFDATPARAQTMDEMRAELKSLRAEIDQLKRQPPVAVVPAAQEASPAAPAVPTAAAIAAMAFTPVPDPRTAGRLRAAAAAASEPQSAIPGGILIPGTTTSVHLYGIAEAHAIHDIKQSSSPDVFTDLTFQPLNSSGGRAARPSSRRRRRASASRARRPQTRG